MNNACMKQLNRVKIILVLFAFLINGVALAKEVSMPESIIVITSDKKPMNNIDYLTHTLSQVGGTLDIYNLDSVQSFEDSFSQDLPTNEDEARKVFEKRMTQYGAKKFEQDIIKAYKGLLSSLAYGVDRYPVIIFNGTDAIYGMTDLKAALLKYQEWRLMSND